MSEPSRPGEPGFPVFKLASGVSVVRPDDLFVARIETQHLSRTVERERDGTAKAWLKPDGTGAPRIVLHMQAQSIAEQAFFETAPAFQGGSDENPTAASIPVGTRLAGPSRLVFLVPANSEPIGYSLAEILDACRGLPLSLASTALPPPSARRPFFRPAWVGELDPVLVDGGGDGVSTAMRARVRARVQRWEDNSDLQPVTRLGPLNLFDDLELNRASALARDQRLVLEPATGVGVHPEGEDAAESRGGPAAVGARPVMSRPGDGGATQPIPGTRPRPGPTPEPGPTPGPGPVLPGPVILPPDLHAPTAVETALELPYRLFISPNSHARWAHATEPVTSPRTGRTELWHTRLGTLVTTPDGAFVDENDHPLRTIRGIWARDQEFSDDIKDHPQHPNPPEPFRMSLDRAHRFEIVHASANFKLPDYVPKPVEVNRLMLTSLGAWVDCRGRWDIPDSIPLELEEWRHRATMARDHYVRIVTRGFLFPFGHRATLVQVTERKFHPNVAGNPAFLRQRMYIVVRQPQLTFGDRRLTNGAGHFYDFQMPFTSVRITTLVTPNLDDPTLSDYPLGGGGQGQSLFWPRVGNEYFRFHMVAEDLEANRVEFSAPLVFVSKVLFNDVDMLTAVKNDYEAAGAMEKARRTIDLHGQRLALAESKEPGDTTFEVEHVVLGAEIPDDTTFQKFPGDRARFYPRVQRAKIVVPTIKQLTGGSGKTEVGFAEDYLKKGLPTPSGDNGNPGEVFLQTLAETALDFTEGGDKSGALVQPNMSVAGISRLMGPVGANAASPADAAAALSDLADGNFTPSSFFDSITAKLFGVISLGELIDALLPNELQSDLVPKFITEAIAAADSFIKDVERAQQMVQQVQAAATAAGASLGTVADQAQQLIDDVVGAVTTMLGGDVAGGATALNAALGDLTTSLVGLKTAINGLPQPVPSEPKKAAISIIDKVLKLISDVTAFIDRLTSALQVPEELKISFEWKPTLQHWPVPNSEDDSIFLARNTKSNRTATLTVAAEAQAKTALNPSPSFDVACRLHSFTLNLFPSASFLRLHFNKIEFVAGSATKPDVVCDFDDVEFVGVLSFVEALRDLIPLDGFSDPPALDVSEKGIVASYSLGLPDVSFGVFSLKNLSLGAGFTVPFLVDPLSVRFQFCERESPFILTVSAIGGGGFFGITLDPDGVQILEAAFEVGADLSINLGVASGSVHIMVGIYFKMQNDDATLEGYVRIGGEMDILAIVSLSVELYLSMTYEFSSGKCVGRATLTIEIELLFFSIPVEITCERRFAGSSGDPTFEEIMAPEGDVDPWAQYCEAFA